MNEWAGHSPLSAFACTGHAPPPPFTLAEAPALAHCALLYGNLGFPGKTVSITVQADNIPVRPPTPSPGQARQGEFRSTTFHLCSLPVV